MELNIKSITEFQKQFEVGTIYLVIKKKLDEEVYMGFVYCMDIDNGARLHKFTEDDKATIFYIYGRSVICDTIDTGLFVDSTLDWHHNFHEHQDNLYHVDGTAFNILYNSIHNFVLYSDNSGDIDYEFIPVYKLNKLQQAYFMVYEDLYINNGDIDIVVESKRKKLKVKE